MASNFFFIFLLVDAFQNSTIILQSSLLRILFTCTEAWAVAWDRNSGGEDALTCGQLLLMLGGGVGTHYQTWK